MSYLIARVTNNRDLPKLIPVSKEEFESNFSKFNSVRGNVARFGKPEDEQAMLDARTEPKAEEPKAEEPKAEEPKSEEYETKVVKEKTKVVKPKKTTKKITTKVKSSDETASKD